MGIRRTMAHLFPTQIRRFCRCNSTFVLANLLAAALVWSAYNNGYMENIQENFFERRDYDSEEKNASATGWIDPPHRGPPTVEQACTPPPYFIQESLPDISNADKSMKPPLKDFSSYEFGTNFEKVRSESRI